MTDSNREHTSPEAELPLAEQPPQESGMQEAELPADGQLTGTTPANPSGSEVADAAGPEQPERVEVVGVRFRGRGKVYYFDPAGTAPAEGQNVIVETAKGNEFGQCTQPVHSVPADTVVMPLRPVLRIATEADERIAAQNREKEARALEICQEKIEAHGLDMKLVDVEYSFEGTKILFFFTSDGRVDFRELVKDLASVFRTRIELRQIGVRDGAKLLGGLGICGRPFCCSTFLDEFQPVSIKMAKTQSLSLNPAKISGTCGRLMCCLKYEQEAYEHLLKTAPKADAQVDTPMGHGVVTEVNLLKQTAKVRLDDPSETTLQTFPLRRMGYTVGGVYKAPEPEEELEEQAPEMDKYGFLSMWDEPPAQPRRRQPGRRPQRDASKKPDERNGEGKPDEGNRKKQGQSRQNPPRAGEKKRPPAGRQGAPKSGEKNDKNERKPRPPEKKAAEGAAPQQQKSAPRRNRRRRKPGGGQNNTKPAQES